ncbi:MAG: alpha/beta-hydrolase N-terminal domain-containing protein, partial [Micrococcales bacterium]|nr:alpha/beta-hydrolase N-terminal domain-containing protein [Micrococcales bacterium]
MPTPPRPGDPVMDLVRPPEPTLRTRVYDDGMHLAQEVLRRHSGIGIVVAALFYVAANTPSLLPRPWWLQGIIAAVCAVLGYAVGYLLGLVWHGIVAWTGLRVTMDQGRARVLIGVVVGLFVLAVLAFPFLTISWQQYVTSYVKQQPPGIWYPVGSTAVALVVFAVTIALWRLVRALLHWLLARVESRIVREAVARVVASALTLVAVVLAIQFLNPIVMAAVEHNAARVNNTLPAGRQAPTSSLRTGGPGSPWSWESLGQDGANFVSSGSDAAGIKAATGRPARSPIRVFVGQGENLEQTRDAVLGELDRTHAWERKAILVTTPTSTGFINTWGSAAFECLLDGDTAIAAMAYSDLPSAFALLTARQDPPEAARLLLDGVRARVAALPPQNR